MERTRSSSTRKGTLGQRERFKDNRHDTYLETRKWPDNTACDTCGAVYTRGRWTWARGAEAAETTTCPACRRIADRYPAGFLTLRGPFLAEHRDEIMGLIHNLEADEKREHPLERIMRLEETPDQMVVETTGIHLPRRIGSALESAYEGHLDVDFGDGSHTIRVAWER